VDPVSLLDGWQAGQSLPDLAATHLSEAPNPAWRIEQMVDAVANFFEHYLSWTVGAVVELVNTRLADAGTDIRLCPELGGYIRYGVRDRCVLILMTSGIRSRRLAHAILNTGLAIEVEIDTPARPPTLSITLPVGDSANTP
jgi:hypothetical protein